MPTKTLDHDNNAVIRYAVKKHFGGKLNVATEVTGYSAQQIKTWLEGTRKPRDATVEYFLSVAMITEFAVVCEFKDFRSDAPTRTQVRNMLNGHHDSPGLYAFFDSMGRPLYVGKAKKLATEIISALARDVTNLSFPKGISAPAKRSELVSYISAYHVGNYSHIDYPKHVESLILRIAKPSLNKNIGLLYAAIPKKPEDGTPTK